MLVCCASAMLPVPGFARTDLDRLELVGAVRTVVTKHPQLKTTHHFDRQGQLTSLELVPTTESKSVRYEYLRDAAGRLKEEQTYEPDGKMMYRKVFGYVDDEHGRQSAQIAATETGALAHADFSYYNDRGVLAEELMISGQGVAEKSLYDVAGELVYHARYFQGRLVQEATYHYAPLGRLKESRYYGPDGELMRKDFYHYDHDGHRSEEVSEFHRQSHLRKSVITYEFDHPGNWTKETIQRWGEDKNGGLVLTETVVSRERTITYY